MRTCRFTDATSRTRSLATAPHVELRLERGSQTRSESGASEPSEHSREGSIQRIVGWRFAICASAFLDSDGELADPAPDSKSQTLKSRESGEVEKHGAFEIFHAAGDLRTPNMIALLTPNVASASARLQRRRPFPGERPVLAERFDSRAVEARKRSEDSALRPALGTRFQRARPQRT